MKTQTTEHIRGLLMDWLDNFKQRFKDYPELKHLKENKFQGSLVINFCNGLPENLDYKMHRRAVKIDGEYKDVRQGRTRIYKDGQFVGYEQP